jgi:hypothetical protein
MAAPVPEIMDIPSYYFLDFSISQIFVYVPAMPKITKMFYTS